MSDWSRELTFIQQAGFRVERGLSTSERQQVEARYRVRFPPDLSAFLSAGLPIGNGFPDWRNEDLTQIADRLAWPADGICFDIEHAGFWWPEWGQQPSSLDDAFRLARARVAEAPQLVPLYGHRYLPAEPYESGNPVLSVYQTDIIYYGSDLRSWLAVEFGGAAAGAAAANRRHIRFWSELVEGIDLPQN